MSILVAGKEIDMKGKLLIILIVLLPALCLAGEPEVFTDTDLKKYGGSYESSGDSNHCSVVDYDSYTRMGGSLITGALVKKGPTYLAVKIKNKSTQKRIVYTSRDIKVNTIKGNVMSPENSETYEIEPGGTVTISGLKFKQISEIVSIECSCW
jgi:hypothetical protein